MGFGLPSALGVQMAYPDETVVCVTGEGSIQMCIQELSVAKQYDLPVKIINLNNRYLGMVRQWQEFMHGNRESDDQQQPDYSCRRTEIFTLILSGWRLDIPMGQHNGQDRQTDERGVPCWSHCFTQKIK